jgi:competence protein ComEC
MTRLLIAFAVGVWLAQQQQTLLPRAGVLLLLTLMVGVAWFTFQNLLRSRGQIFQKCSSIWSVFGLVVCLALGLSYANWRAEIRMAQIMPVALEREPLVIEGVVANLPDRDERGQRFMFDIERTRVPENAALPRRVALSWFAAIPGDEVPLVRAGERWRLSVRLQAAHGFANPHGFDVEAWLLERGIRATGSVSAETDAQRRLAADAGRWRDRVNRLRERTRARMQAALPDARWSGVLIALTLGDQNAVSRDDWNTFNATGISHLLSISGAHVTLFASALAASP